jgi:hypothetical protein
MTGFVPAISNRGKRKEILSTLHGTTKSTWIFLIQKNQIGERNFFMEVFTKFG